MTIHVNLELTDHCNLKCKMCSQSMRKLAHGEAMTFMDFSTWKQGIDGLKNIVQEVAISPHWLGEPTLHPEFDRFISYAFEHNESNILFREFKLHTNAVIFPKSRSQLLLQVAQNKTQAPNTFRFIHFSVDAFSPEVYKDVKGGNRREQVYDNIARFLQLRHNLNAAFPKVALGFVVQPENFHEARVFLEFWKYMIELYDNEVLICSDWPHQEKDSIYFRPLNTKDQLKSNQLHRETVQKMGIPYTVRSSSSF